MILLTSTSDKIQVVSGSTQNIRVHASYVDLNGSTVTPGRLNSTITTATTTDVVGAPASSTQRNVKHLSIQNEGTLAETVVVQHTDGTTIVQLQDLSLAAGYTLVYEDGAGWQLQDASGNIQQALGTGRWLKRTYILNGTTAFTTTASTTSIIARMLAAGGQGGGSPATTGIEGAGGGSGSYAEWSVAVSPSTGYTCAVGAGGSTSGTNATGQVGGNTTLQVGATTVTCNGGGGGVVGTSISVPVLGGAGGAISTNGTLNIPGNAGEPSVCIAVAADNRSGKGADSPLGNGGASLLNAANTTGNNAGGFGSGGGGSASTGTAQKGGTGANGIIVIDEYS